jgi:basic amino acid/polyamine antiporter, APA family
MRKGKSPATQVARIDKGGFKRALRLSDLFAIGYGDLGSSIYYALGITALYALGATPIALGLAGIVFICNALSYAELTAMYPQSGGSASFARQAFNDTASFIAGWGLLLDYIVTIAISAFSIFPYLSVFYAPLKFPDIQISFTVGVIVLLFIINFFGVRRSTRLSFVLTSLAILTQILIIVLGAVLVLNLPRVIDHFKIGVPGVDWSPSWPDFMRGVAMAMVAYTGIESIAQLGAESRQPTKNLPRAIFLNMLALIILYLGISVIGLSALSPSRLGHDFANDPIAGIVQSFPFGGAVFAPWVGLLAAILLFVASNAGMIGSSRLAFNMGEFYQLPQFFSSLHLRFRTPAISLAFFSLLACVLVVLSRGRLTFLADLYNFGAMVAFFSTNISLLALRIKKPHEVRPYKIPFNIRFRGYELPISAMIGAIGSLAVWILVVITKPDGRYLGMAWMVVGILVFFLYRRKKNLSARGSLAVYKVKVAKVELPVITNILVPVQSIEDRQIIYAACDLAKAHKATLTILHIIEVPLTLPLDSELTAKLLGASNVLQYAEAIVRETDVHFELSVLRGRAFGEVIREALKEKQWQLLVLSSNHWEHRTISALSHVLHQKAIRVWVCY